MLNCIELFKGKIAKTLNSEEMLITHICKKIISGELQPNAPIKHLIEKTFGPEYIEFYYIIDDEKNIKGLQELYDYHLWDNRVLARFVLNKMTRLCLEKARAIDAKEIQFQKQNNKCKEGSI